MGLSFVRQRRRTSTYVREHTRLPSIAKIEKPQAVEHLQGITEVRERDFMVARGDLGVELPPEKVPTILNAAQIPHGARARQSMTATQMLDSMAATGARPRRGRRRRQRDPRRHRRGDASTAASGSALCEVEEAIEMMAAIAKSDRDGGARTERWNQTARVHRDSARSVLRRRVCILHEGQHRSSS